MCSEIITLSNLIGNEGFYNMQTADIDEFMRKNPLYEDNLIIIMTIDDSKEVHNYQDKFQQLTANFIREGLQFTTSLEQQIFLKAHLQIYKAGYQELFKQLEKSKNNL